MNTDQRSGWVLRRFLYLTPRAIHHHIDIYTCFGGDPSWLLKFGVGTHFGFPIGISYESKDQKVRYSQDYFIYGLQKNGHLLVTANDNQHSIVPSLRRKRTAITLVSRQICVDEMSEREFGLSVDFMRSEGDRSYKKSGCCSLATTQPPAMSN